MNRFIKETLPQILGYALISVGMFAVVFVGAMIITFALFNHSIYVAQ